MVSRLALQSKAKLLPLSKTHIIDCSRDNCFGCEGGVSIKVYKYINEHGGLYEDDYREYSPNNESQKDCQKPEGKVGKGEFAAFTGIGDPSEE